MTCPNCGSPMREQPCEETYGRRITLDVCHACQGLWFDGNELLQMSPAATLELFSAITREPPAHQAAMGTPTCPRCVAALAESSDMQRTTRFFFLRCPRGHGRFLTFFQFLRAKNFVRSLSEAEIRHLREYVRHINCSNCGVAVDVERGAICGYCRTPISMLDPGQVQATVGALSAAAMKRRQVDPALPIALMHERLRVERAFGAEPGAFLRSIDTHESMDLVRAGLRVLGGLFKDG
jgi:Zn-finger nucleic acid-binding protein